MLTIVYPEGKCPATAAIYQIDLGHDSHTLKNIHFKCKIDFTLSAPLFHIKCNSVSHQAVVIYIYHN